MVKTLFILFSLIALPGCSKDDIPEIIQFGPNTVFYCGPRSAGASITLYGTSRSIDVNLQCQEPQCDSPFDENNYWLLYLKDGRHKVTVQTSTGPMDRTITIHEHNCNRFNTDHVANWQ